MTSCDDTEMWVAAAVDQWPAAQAQDTDDESMGTKKKFWVQDSAGQQWLFKYARTDKRDGTVSGEDWAECVVHSLAGLLGIPSAHVRPATYNGERGVLSLNLAPPSCGYRLAHGDEYLARAFGDRYHAKPEKDNPHHTVLAVRRSLAGVGLPPMNTAAPLTGAFDLWSGYLLMDAWVAGTDRHPQNWGVLASGEGTVLCPTYDHGNALGFQLRDDKRARCLKDGGELSRWVERGANSYFRGKPPLLRLACRALCAASPQARSHWAKVFGQLDMQAVADSVAQVPERLMSEVGRMFVVRLLTLNRERIIDACEHCS